MMNLIDRLLRYALGGGLPKLIFVVGLAAGVIALIYTPREEEPQIVVPMIDVVVEAPGLLSLIHISEPTRPTRASRMPSSA